MLFIHFFLENLLKNWIYFSDNIFSDCKLFSTNLIVCFNSLLQLVKKWIIIGKKTTNNEGKFPKSCENTF